MKTNCERVDYGGEYWLRETCGGMDELLQDYDSLYSHKVYVKNNKCEGTPDFILYTLKSLMFECNSESCKQGICETD